MIKFLPIQIKSAFLLVIFGANTLIGFCCSIGLNMSFSFGAKQESCICKSTHKHHVTDKKPNKSKVHHNKKNSLNEGTCCNGKVVKLAQSDKSLGQSTSIINPVFFNSLINTFFTFNSSLYPRSTPPDRHFLKNFHPPIPDIRIAINSFQI